MAQDYLYGTYGHLADSVVSAASESATAAVYIGTAPVNLIRGYSAAGVVNRPVKLKNYLQAQRTVGIATDWDKFTLSEAIEAHFNNVQGNIGPIYVINVLDPAVHIKTETVEGETVDTTTVSLAFTNGRASIVSDTIILDTLVLDGKAEGTDYTVAYDMLAGRVNIISADTENPITGTVTATFKEVDPSLVTASEIIGTKTAAGVYSGMQAAELIYQEYGVIPVLYAAPGWSQNPTIYRALLTIAQDLCGHWDGFVYADIPTVYNSTEIDTIAKAVAWKKENGYTSERSKVFWPLAKGSDGKVYHISALAMAETLRVDQSHDGVPYETCGNKAVPVVAQYFSGTSESAGFTEDDSRDLTSEGIATVVFWAGSWKLWGDSTAAYTFGDSSVDARAYFDVTIRMLLYLTNGFQTRWASSIDKPMDVQLKDTILVREQELLDGLVNRGALIGNPVIEFLEENNSSSDLIQGNFRWDIQATPTLPLKSATAYVAYTDAGLQAYLG